MSTLTDEVGRARRLPPPATAREIRRAAGVTQARLAVELGVHRVTVARWEGGSRMPSGKHRLAYVELLEDLRREVLST